MNELLHADIFFFVTTIAVILIAVGVIVALYYVIKILRNVSSVSDRLEEGSKAIEEDLHDLRIRVKAGGISLALARAFFKKASGWFSGRKKTRRSASSMEEASKE